MKLVLGTVQFGLEYGINSQGRPSQDSVVAILSAAKESRINMLDTSASYGDSEVVLGNTMGSGGVGFRIISKYPKSAQSVGVVLSKTLCDLKQDSVYGYLLHHFEVYKDDPSVWREFEAVRSKGRVGKIGFSLYNPDELELIFERGDKFDLVQFPYNIFDRQFEPYMPELKKRGVEIHVRSTFLQGLFFKDVNTLPSKLMPMKRYLVDLHDYARSINLSIAQVALNFNLQNINIDGVLIGVDNVAQLEENISAISDTRIDINIDVREKELLSPVNWR